LEDVLRVEDILRAVETEERKELRCSGAARAPHHTTSTGNPAHTFSIHPRPFHLPSPIVSPAPIPSAI